MKTSIPVNRIAFNELLHLFKSKTEHHFILPNDLGKGHAEVYDLEKGLQVRFWNVNFNQKVELYNNIACTDEDSYFTLAFFLNTRGILFSHGGKFLPENLIWDTLFISNVSDYKMYISPFVQGCCLGVSFSKKWLKNNLLNRDKGFDPLEEKINSIELLSIHESMNATTKRQIKELMDKSGKNSLGSFYIKSCILKLLSEFFYRIKEKNLSVNNLAIYNPINEIEKYLQNNITEPLPTLREVSNRFSLSPSTLSRNFKKVYGSNISTYFIRKKMEYALSLINKGHKNISEVAALVGYKSVDNFRTMFRKHT